ncbi:MAG: permease-like cell division protein FtsX [Candidatus Kerfeldbacteria bacterium]|nr:permease-like cell division protein FtsX [Candidatus Kerfeldbacteria bacterium]
MFVGFFRALRFSLQNIIRNVWLSVITMFLLFLTMLSITLVVSLNIVGGKVIGAVEQNVSVSFYFYDSASESQILEAQSYLEEIDATESVVYVSKDQALQEFTETHAEDPEVLAAIAELTDNVLPASLLVRAKNINEYQTIISRFEESEYILLVESTDFTDSKQVIDTITHTINRIYDVGIAVSIIFILISVVVIFNAIRMTIYSHKEEVGIMQLVGATNGFIRAPFILDSIIFGCVAALAVIALLYAGLYLTDSTVSQFFAGYNFSLLQLYAQHWVVVCVSEIVVAILISGVSSTIAISRYLKV